MIISNFPGGGGSSGGKLPEKVALSQCSWKQISAVCRAGLAKEYWAIGDKKYLIDGNTTLEVRIIGFDHDYVSDISAYGREKAGITFHLGRVNGDLLYPMHTDKTASISWDNCAMRTVSLPIIMDTIVPADLKKVIVPVGKEFYDKSTNTIKSVSDKIFMLSANEVFNGFSSGVQSGGKGYEFFLLGNTKHVYIGSATCKWWTRSPNATNLGNFIGINNNSASVMDSDLTGVYAAFGFCL